jgi:TfoX/Sxy family transcriptional regulator of competence genes
VRIAAARRELRLRPRQFNDMMGPPVASSRRATALVRPAANAVRFAKQNSVLAEEGQIMAYDEKTAERIRLVLGSRGNIVEKKMMGGLAFTVRGGMCCYLSRKGYFLLRVTPEVRDETLAMAHVKPTDFAGRRMSGFVLVEPEGFRTEAALAKWLERGIANATALQAIKPAKKTAAKKAAPKPRSAKSSRR